MPLKKKRKTNDSRVFMMAPIPLQQLQPTHGQPLQPMCGATLASTRGSRSTSSESEDSEERRVDKMFRTGGRLIRQLPKVHVQGILEAVDQRFDATFTSHLDVETLCRILWMVTGTKPTTPCRNMCVKTCKQLYSKMRMAGQRVASNMGLPQHAAMIEQIISTKDLAALVEERGFYDERLVAKSGGKCGLGRPSVRPAALAPTQGASTQRTPDIAGELPPRACPASAAEAAQHTEPAQLAESPRHTLDRQSEGSCQSEGRAKAATARVRAKTERTQLGHSPSQRSCQSEGSDSGSSSGSSDNDSSSDGPDSSKDEPPVTASIPEPPGPMHSLPGSDAGSRPGSSTGGQPQHQSRSAGHKAASIPVAASIPEPTPGHPPDDRLPSPPATTRGPSSPGGGPSSPAFDASARAEQLHNLNDRIAKPCPSEDDMLVLDAFASIRKFLGQDASDGGVAGQHWAELLKGAYPEWSDSPLDRSLACLVCRCRLHRGDTGSHRQVDSIEYWAGHANLTRAMVEAGHECSRFDLKYSPAHNCLTPAGLRLWLEELCHSSEQCLVWLGTQCSSFVALCMAQSRRRAENGFLGDETRRFVHIGNQQMRVGALLYFISFLLGNCAVLEQPVNSNMPHSQPMAGVLQYCCPTRTVTWLGQFGGSTPKPLQLYHTHPEFAQLRRSRPTGEMTTLTTRDGKKFSGKKHALRESQEYPEQFGRAVRDVVAAIRR